MNAALPVRLTKTDALLAHIRGLGRDKYQNPVGIRTTALAEAAGVPAKSIQALLDPSIKRGDLVVCKITNASGQQEREYRAGPGVPPPEFKPLNSRRGPGSLVVSRNGQALPAAMLSTPMPAADQIAAPVFLKSTQPEVVATSEKTPAAGGRPPIRPAPAVAAQATPGPTARAVLKKEPAARSAPAGDVRIGINDAGTLVIALGDASIELNPKQAKRLGHFMTGTQGVWNPF